MSMLRLLGVAAQAEGLRLRREADGFGRRAVMSGAAGLFGVLALLLLHVALWLWLAEGVGAAGAALILAVVDAGLMLAALLLARPGRDLVAEEALLLRRQALAELRAGGPATDALRLFGGRGPAFALGGAVVEGLIRALLRR